MTTITPITSIKSSISFIPNLKVFQNTDLRFNKSYLLTSWGQRGNWCYVSKRLRLLHRSILTVKSLKRTLYSLPKTILIYPYTPLHDVNVTSIIQQYKNSHSNLFIFGQIYVLISIWKRGGIDVVFSLFPLRHMKLQFVLWTGFYCLVTMIR